MKAALNSAVDIVVTDAVMPNLDGNELCRFFRSSPQFAHIPVVLLSALEKKDSYPGCEPDVFLGKPVSPERLLECLEEMLVATK
jgi:CheY-like chemotaxis protein